MTKGTETEEPGTRGARRGMERRVGAGRDVSGPTEAARGR